MFCQASETFQMGLDALAPLDGGRWLLCGWVLHPPGQEPALAFTGPGGRPLELLFEGRHPRPDVPLPQGAPVELRGFHIVVQGGGEGRAGLLLTARAAGQEIRARLGDPAVATDLGQVLLARPWAQNMALLEDAQRAGPLLAPLLGGGAFPLRAWLGAMARPDRWSARCGPAAELRAGVTPAGDAALALRPAPGEGPVRAQRLRLAWLARGEEGSLSLLGLASWQALPVGGALIGWGRLDPPPAPGEEVEAVVQADLGGTPLWARVEAPCQGLGGLCDGLGAAALGPEPGPARRGALGMALAALLAERLAWAGPCLRACLAGEEPPRGPPLPLLPDVEEEMALRLLEALAPALAALPGPLLLFGAAAAQGCPPLEARGLRALAGAEALRALEGEGARPALALGMRELAEAMIGERLDAALRAAGRPLAAATLWRLHGLAAPGAGLAATLARLRGDAGEGLGRAPACPDAAPALSAHLDALWREVPRHG